jgi:hypothetical protein
LRHIEDGPFRDVGDFETKSPTAALPPFTASDESAAVWSAIKAKMREIITYCFCRRWRFGVALHIVKLKNEVCVQEVEMVF